MKSIIIKTTAMCLSAVIITASNPNVTNAMPVVLETETAVAGVPVLLGDYYNSHNGNEELEAVLTALKADNGKKTLAVETSGILETTNSTTAASTQAATKVAESTAAEASTTATVETEAGEIEVRIASDTEFTQKEVRESNYKSIYAKVAIAKVENYVNVRSTPDTESADNIVGRIYNNCAAMIEEVVDGEDGDWFFVKSGDVEGYIKADLFVTGVQAKRRAADVGVITAKVLTESLRVRESASLDAEVLTQLEMGSTYTVLQEEKDGFVKVRVVDGLEGYVYAENVEVNVAFDWAVSNEEQAARQKAIEELQFEVNEADCMYFSYFDNGNYANATAAAEDWAELLSELSSKAGKYHFDDIKAEADARLQTVKEYITVSAQKAAEAEAAALRAAQQAAQAQTQPATQPQTQAPVQTQPATQPQTQAPAVNVNTSSVRQAIVNEAVSWVGRCNYVYGGTNLTVGGGVDCSGFTQTIYKRIAGITINRTSYTQVNNGTRISFDQLQPGDLVFYGNGGGINHVAIYIGNGQIVHAKNPSAGIGIDSLNYKAPVAAVSILG